MGALDDLEKTLNGFTKDDTAILQFALDLREKDLSECRAGDLLNLREDLANLLGWGWISGEQGANVPASNEDPGLPSEHDLWDLQEFLKEHFSPPTEGKLKVEEQTDGSVRLPEFMFLRSSKQNRQEPVSLMCDLVFNPPPAPLFQLKVVRPPDGSMVAAVRGSVIEVFSFRLTMALLDLQVKVSACPECSTLFVVLRGRKYCCRRCANLASVKRYYRRNKRKESSDGT